MTIQFCVRTRVRMDSGNAYTKPPRDLAAPPTGLRAPWAGYETPRLVPVFLRLAGVAVVMNGRRTLTWTMTYEGFG